MGESITDFGVKMSGFTVYMSGMSAAYSAEFLD